MARSRLRGDRRESEDGLESGGTDAAEPGRRSGARRPTLAERVAAGAFSDEELTERAREAALRVLSAAPKSRAELAASLARKGYPERTIDPLLLRFENVGLLDDAQYAEMVVRTRHTERGLARRAILAELRRRGIEEEIAQSALAQVADDDEDAAAVGLARARLARTRGLDREVRLRRAVGALARKGYPPGRAYEIVQRELAGDEQGDVGDEATGE